MATQGASTNRVKEIVGKLSPDLIYSKPTVSRITQELDLQIKRWQDERLKDCYTYIITDALYFYVRIDHQVVSSPLPITIGINRCGYRKMLGVDFAYEESYQSYLNHFSRSKERGTKVCRSDHLR